MSRITRQFNIFVAIILAIFILTACVPTPIVRNETINELIISNQTNSALEDVKLRVPKTNSLISCNVILPRTECSLGFAELENERNPATLSWIQKGQQYQRDIVTQIPDDLDKSKPSKVIITIEDNGKMTSRLGQE